MVTRSSTADKKTPIETIIPSMVNNKKPIVAKAIFSSLVFTKDRSDIILTTTDRPRNENRMKSSSSFMC